MIHRLAINVVPMVEIASRRASVVGPFTTDIPGSPADPQIGQVQQR
jgi:hypothetical protein